MNAQTHLTEWTHRFREPMFKFAVLNLSSLDDAEDVVQDTFEALLLKIDQWHQIEITKAYLFGILKNKIKDKLRARYRHQPPKHNEAQTLETLLFSDSGAWYQHTAPALWQDMEETHQKDAFFAVLDICINQLPYQHASVFSMKHLLDCDTDEILSVLQISKDNYWQSMSRAKKQIHFCLNERWYEGETL